MYSRGWFSGVDGLPRSLGDDHAVAMGPAEHSMRKEPRIAQGSAASSGLDPATTGMHCAHGSLCRPRSHTRAGGQAGTGMGAHARPPSAKNSHPLPPSWLSLATVQHLELLAVLAVAVQEEVVADLRGRCRAAPRPGGRSARGCRCLERVPPGGGPPPFGWEARHAP